MATDKGNRRLSTSDRPNATKMSFSRKPGGDRILDVDQETDESRLTDVDDDEDYKKCDCVAGIKKGIIPYKTIYDPLDANLGLGPQEGTQYFIPGKPVKARVISASRDPERLLNMIAPYVYTIEVEHDNQIWYVDRKYTEFQHWNNRLILHSAAQMISGPMLKGIFEGHEEPKTVTSISHEKDGLVEMPSVNLSNPAVARMYFAGANFDAAPSEETEGMCQDFVRPGPAFPPGGGAPRATPETSEPASRETPMTPGAVSRSSRRKLRAHKMPKLPFKPEAWIGAENVYARQEELQTYLDGVLHIPSLRNHKETAVFLDVSRISFIHNLEHKWKEGMAVKKPGGHLDVQACLRMCHDRCGKWNQRWFAIKDSFLAYLHPGTDMVREVMLFDNTFHARVVSLPGIGVTQGVTFTNLSRELLMQCKTAREADQWAKGIQYVFEQDGKQWREVNQFGSTYPVRHQSYAQWFVDGKNFFEHVAHMCELAKEEIFIANWFLTPEIFMKRPPKREDPWQLMNILKRKAEQGVHVFILLYKEFEKVMDNGSSWAKRKLQSLHPRILVARHPDHTPVPLIWAHHEKVVIIDQNIAFAGGLDLCYGRWDDHKHRLSDLGTPFVHPYESTLGHKGGDTRPSDEDPALECLKVAEQNQQFHYTVSPQLVTRFEVDPDTNERRPRPRSGSRSRSRSRSITRNGHDNESIELDQNIDPQVSPVKARALPEDVDKLEAFLETHKQKIRKRLDTPPKSTREKMKQRIEEWRTKTRENDSKRLYKDYERAIDEVDQYRDLCLDYAQGEYWIGKDYTNWFLKYTSGYELPYVDLFDRRTTWRTPWHDCACVVYGAAARDLARHFIQRWNACKEEKLNDDEKYPFLVPKSYVHIHIPNIFRRMSHPCTAQIIRSGYRWSVGITAIDESIHQAYLKIINESKHFIYIENQFFVSFIGSSFVKNMVGKAIFDRIVKAHRMNENFKVYIFMPLLPCFEGELGTVSGLLLANVLHVTYTAISRGSESLLVNLYNEIGDAYKNYIRFYSLRKFEELSGRLITSVVYIHTKAIVVDDTHAIIGSANINDRSLKGDRDSEVAIYIEDSDFVDSTMNGRPYKAGRFGQSLRKRFMAEHLGLLDENENIIESQKDPIDLDDPVSEEFFEKFNEIAKNNTEIYDKVFKCFPADSVRTWQDLADYKDEAAHKCPAVTNRNESNELLDNVRGYLVEFPTKFMEAETLAPTGSVLPESVLFPFT